MTQRTKAWNLRRKMKAELFPEVEYNSFSRYAQIRMPRSSFSTKQIKNFIKNKQKYFQTSWKKANTNSFRKIKNMPESK